MDRRQRRHRGRAPRARHRRPARAGRLPAGRARAARPNPSRRRPRARAPGRQQPEGLDERAEVLPRLERCNREQVRLRALGLRPLGGELGADPGMGDHDLPARVAERRGGVVRGEGRVGEDHAAGARGICVLAAVHGTRPAGDPFRKVQRDEIVDRRRPQPGALGRIHPVGEVEHVEGAEEALGRRIPEP